ncbi:MAG: undecaprenyl-diphosphate phosphatase, partial [Beijerinckiaceae bacterium]|nr:undecaprenyl-diphosphate phosphatase [Beijerinckiaceae bacterium]
IAILPGISRSGATIAAGLVMGLKRDASATFAFLLAIPAIGGAGQKFTVANQLLGTTPTFQAVFYTTFQGQAISLKLNNCTSSKLSFHTKLEDFVMPEFDFSCFADSAGNVMTWSFGEAS